MLKAGRQLSQTLLQNRFFRFLLAGGLAALINFGSRFFYSLFMDFGAAVVVAYITGMTTAYVLNRLFVFDASRNSVPQEVAWFILVNVFALLQTWGLSVFLAGWLPERLPIEGARGVEMAQAIAHGAGILLPVFTSYIGHKYLTFRE